MYLGGRELREAVRARVIQLGGPELSGADVATILRAYADVATQALMRPGSKVSLPGVGRLVSRLVEARRRFNGLRGKEEVTKPRLKIDLVLAGSLDREKDQVAKLLQRPNE